MNKLKASLLAATALALGGCTTLDVFFDKAVKIDGEAYYFNKDGEIEMSAEKLAKLQEEHKVLRIKHVSKTDALILDPAELTVLMQDEDVFFSKLDKNPLIDEKSFLLSKGSLKENIVRLAQEAEWESIEWSAQHNYYIESPQAVLAEDYLSIAFEILSPYPVMTSFDSELNQLKVSEGVAEAK